MYYDHPGSGFGVGKILLSLAMMVNMSMLLGLSQRDLAEDLIAKIKTVKKAQTEIAHYQPMIEKSMAELEEIGTNQPN